jgi:hypothetical protein
MSDKLGLQIDDDWKKQAQEEKRRLAEKAAAASASSAVAPSAAKPSTATAAGEERQAPQASFPTLVRSIMTQALLYLGELAMRGGESMLNLDMAKYQIDLLGVLEEKCKGNLSPEEQKLLDLTLYDLRSRFVSTSSQYIM